MFKICTSANNFLLRNGVKEYLDIPEIKFFFLLFHEFSQTIQKRFH